jgi:SIR2-like domain
MPGRAGTAIDALVDSARRGELVCVIGTGVSLTLTNAAVPALSWKGLVRDGFAHAVTKGKMTPAQADMWKAQVDSDDLDALLGAAEFMGRKLGAPHNLLYGRWLEQVFKDIEPANKHMVAAVGRLAAGLPLCTLNYDTLLERVTGQPTITLADVPNAVAWMRSGVGHGILHLHGAWTAPATCILGVRDYQTTLAHESRELLQRALGAFRRLLFIGCGDTFADPNFSALIGWLREHMKTAPLEHYALVNEAEIAAREADPSWHGFVSPLSYGKTHADLPSFLIDHFPAPAHRKSKTKTPAVAASTALLARLIADYRAFLIKDCGQLTIEGVRADFDTAQRKFNLERIFVPLTVLASPPEFPASDAKREEKLQAWHDEHKEPVSFGAVFAKSRCLALLALPGGGKSLLLRRLAVAYADPTRRVASSDSLPDLDVLPLLIRCREWREHLHRPIETLLQHVASITGQSHLAGLDAALLPLFKKGRVLLLVDGLDEIHDDAVRTTFVGHLERFLGDHKQTRLVVTSREAGFGLVASAISRVCERWRIAPLGKDAITALCGHWHTLMSGESPEVQAESRQVAETLTSNDSLHRLAENPLLLTMLLVVKQGAGRLPPDRVSLYGRAVEVLLDTWNIVGHASLSLKEAVPQLAFLAYEMMRTGKQTATEKEILQFLVDARESVPQIRLYAKDSPHDFLKRVELRSSLLVEAGRQADGVGTVPFYQFRHLTFQEYLAAVAAVEGHYAGFTPGDTVLKPLQEHLADHDWKEVIPMSAVLAKKQAEPLLVALVAAADREYEQQRPRTGFLKTILGMYSVPADRLLQCLIDEAQASPQTLVAALRSILLAANASSSGVIGGLGISSVRRLSALARGPYGEELWRQSWALFSLLDSRSQSVMLCSTLSLGTPVEAVGERREWLNALLQSADAPSVGRGLMAIVRLRAFARAGAWFQSGRVALSGNVGGGSDATSDMEPLVASLVLHSDPAVRCAAILAWTSYRRDDRPLPQPAVLDRCLVAWLDDPFPELNRVGAAALAGEIGRPRDMWQPALTARHVNLLQALVNDRKAKQPDRDAALAVAFHARSVVSDDELAKLLRSEKEPDSKKQALLRQLGAPTSMPSARKRARR